MCGIAGSIFKDNKFDEGVLKSLQHRGPNEQTYFHDHELVLYHTRLSIQDVCDGHQPMQLGDRYVIVFNGEIYNHNELRDKHKLQCQTRSDTETILHLFNLLGIDFLHELDGMFAIALYDRSQQLLWLMRDRAGKKPLYYYNHNEKWFFASELNTINQAMPLEIKHSYFYEYLRLGGFYRSHTPYQHCHELPGGHWMCINLSTKAHQVTQWWNIKDYYLKPEFIGKQDAVYKIKGFLDHAVKSRLETSDLEVGCFLSGGIDSGLVATTAAQFTQKLKTFTVAFPGKYNEAPLAKLVADKIGSNHTEINIDFSDLKDNIETILANYGEPFTDSSAIPTWYVSREAKKHVTVILNGDGADELFGGYRRHVPFAKYDFYNSSKFVKSISKSINNLLPISHEKKSVYNYIYRLTSLVKESNLGVYLAASSDIFEGYIDKAFVDTSENLYQNMCSDLKSFTAGIDSGLSKMLLADFNISLASLFLVKMDIGTMAHALEGRSPFLSKDILEWVPTLPDKLKINGSTTKYLLRSYARQMLPPALINQPKRGFEIPLKKWIEGDLKEMIHSYIFSGSSFSSNFIQPSFKQNLWDRNIRVSEEKRAKMIWTMFALEVWHKKSYLK